MDIGIDFETDRIEGQKLIPPDVCLGVRCEGVSELRAQCEPEYLDLLEFLLGTDDHLIAHNAAFDMAVICANYPHHIPAVWKAICDDRRVHCTIIREKLLNLTSHGSLDYITTPDGTTSRLKYDLASMVQHYFGDDITEQKNDDDSWRVNYSELRALRAQDYPVDAARYVLDDAKYALRIFGEQELRANIQRRERSIDPFETESFRVACDFALTLMSAWGIATDDRFLERFRPCWLKLSSLRTPYCS